MPDDKLPNPLPPPTPGEQRYIQSSRPIDGPVTRFLSQAHWTVFWQSFLVMLGAAVMYAVYEIQTSVTELEENGNQFAGLLWNALPSRVINDAIMVAVVAGIITAIAASRKKGRLITRR